MVIYEICEIQCGKYDTSFEQDLELLAVDDKEKQFTQNERSCILFRSGEKKILKFLMEASVKIRHLYEMSIKNARKFVNIDSEYNYDPIMAYINSTVFPGLQLKENKSLNEGSKAIDKLWDAHFQFS